MEFHHFIISRFNVNITSNDFPSRLKYTWLSLRFELFQKYCFPTVRAQQQQSFTWLVLFDEQTPPLYKKLVQAYAGYENSCLCIAARTTQSTTRWLRAL